MDDSIIRDFELLTEKSASITFGIFGHGDDQNGDLTTRVGGSGVFISPCYGITARHVIRDLFETNPARADALKRKTKGYEKLPHWMSVFQIGAFGDTSGPPAIWGVTRVWDCSVSDLCLLELAPDGEIATARLSDQKNLYPRWSLLPPPVGANVDLAGFPSSRVHLSPSGSQFFCPFTTQQVLVREIFEVRHDRGMYSFPCFSVTGAVDHGFSGGPVFHKGKLCGLVSGGIGDETMVASLWPICLMQIEFPDLGLLNKKEAVGDWFQDGRLKAEDWPVVQRQACLWRDDDQSPAYACFKDE